MNSQLSKYKVKLDEERITKRLQSQLIESLQNQKENWITQRLIWEKEKRELENQIQNLQYEVNDANSFIIEKEAENKEANKIIQELNNEATALRKENQDLLQKLDRETMTIKNLNSLIALQAEKLSSLDKPGQQSRNTTERKSINSPRSSQQKLFQSKKNLVQQSIHSTFSRSNSQASSSSAISDIPHSTQYPAKSPSNRSSTVEVGRVAKRPLELDDTERKPIRDRPMMLNTKMTTDNTNSQRANPFVGNENTSMAAVDIVTRNREDNKENVVDLSDGSSSPPTAYYFGDENEHIQSNTDNGVIDLSSIPSFESVVDNITYKTQSSPPKQECESDRSPQDYKSSVKHEKKEETVDFTSLLYSTPRPALSDSTNIQNLSTSSKTNKNIPKGKNVILRTTNNADLLNNVTNASINTHQHGQGQTCKACAKFYDTEPLIDVENKNIILNSSDRIQLHSKHRSRNGLRESTPPGFWDIDFTLSSQNRKKNL